MLRQFDIRRIAALTFGGSIREPSTSSAEGQHDDIGIPRSGQGVGDIAGSSAVTPTPMAAVTSDAGYCAWISSTSEVAP